MNHDAHHHGGHHHGHGDEEHGGPTDFHGMLVVGEETVYLSHLPMFDHPHHAFQAILEATLTDEGGDPRAVYADDRKRTRTKVYTLAPEEFFLPDLVATDHEHPPHRSSFTGTVYRGHFEDREGRTPVLEGVAVEVTNIVHFRQLDPDAREGLPQLGYLLFGKGQELFMAHQITKPPDFDQVLSVRVMGHEFTDEELRHGVPVFFSGRANSISERIREGEQAAAEAQLAGEDAPRTVEIQVEAGTEFYFEEGELRVPHTFDQTEEERSAGF